MYIELTTRCNMKCAHCCMSATEVGEDMDRDTFLAAIRLAEDYDHFVTMGGGEPTVHPLFWDFLGLAIVHGHSKASVHVITNGKRVQDAKRLARLAQQGIIGAELSLDAYHERVPYEVSDAFRRRDLHGRDHNDLRGIRTVSSILNLGRAAENKIGNRDGCSCDDLLISPDGTIWECAHQEHSFGTVFAPEIPSIRDRSCTREGYHDDYPELEEEDEELTEAA